MAQPELIKDIEARVKKSGDTMTGNLESPMFITDYLKTLNPADNNNPSFIHMDSNQNLLLYNKNNQGFTQLALLTNKFGLNALQFYYKQDTDTDYSQYTIIHTGNLNLITPQSIGALPISGGTLTGPILNFNNGNGQIYNLDDSTNRLFMFRNVFDSNNWSGLQIESPLNKTDLPRINFYQTIDGTLKYIGTILHTGNKNLITPADISAYALVPTGISLSTDVLNLAPGRYQWDGMTTSSEATAMNLPAICWHGEIFIQSTYNITGHANTYKVVTITTNGNEIWQNVLSWNQWTGWKKIITAPFYGVSGTYGINISGSADSSKLTDALRVFSITGEPNNAYSYKLIWTATPSGWKNYRIVLGMSSRHTGNGIICISCGVNDNTVSASTVYGQIVYYGNNNNATALTGEVFNKDMLQLYYNASTNKLFLFLRYYDYNNVQINIIDAYTSGGTKVSLSEFTDGVYVSSIDSATYGSLICQTIKGWVEGDLVTGAVWNDYAEYRKAESIEPGRVVVESTDGEMKLSTERLQPGAEIISDTFGFAIGETDEYKTPIAAAGRVLAYPNEDRYSYPLGCAVCSGPNGTVSQMTREEIKEYPERIIGTVSEIPEYKNWGTGNVKVNGRIWIRIK